MSRPLKEQVATHNDMVDLKCQVASDLIVNRRVDR